MQCLRLPHAPSGNVLLRASCRVSRPHCVFSRTGPGLARINQGRLSTRVSSASAGAEPLPEPPLSGPSCFTHPSASPPSAAAAEKSESKAVPAPFQGVKIIPAIQAIAVGLIIRFMIPIPAGVTAQGWSLLAIFSSTILGLILAPLPVGAWAFLAVTTSVTTKTLTFGQAMGAMTNEVIWLIVVSFFFAKGFEKTGLGERIANIFVRAMGHSTLGLSYGLNIAEAVLGPAMPSTSARAGGVFMPIIKSLSENAGSYPNDPSRKRMGSFLTMSQFQTGIHTGGIFLTGSAQNLLCLDMAKDLGAIVPNAFYNWFMGAIIPALIGMALTPWVLYKLMPPEINETPQAPAEAQRRLDQLGPMSMDEKIMLLAISIALVLWVVGPSIGVSAVLAAMVGLCLLLCAGTLSWKDCLTYTPAWDTLMWFAVLISMSNQLNQMGVIRVFADSVGASLAALNIHWTPMFFLLHLAYYSLHYLFASQTAHVGALYSAFCTMMLGSGVPPILAAITLAMNVNLFGSITHFASGQAAAYYGSGYMNLDEVFKMGAICGLLGLFIWGGIGFPIWKLLGWF